MESPWRAGHRELEQRFAQSLRILDDFLREVSDVLPAS